MALRIAVNRLMLAARTQPGRLGRRRLTLVGLAAVLIAWNSIGLADMAAWLRTGLPPAGADWINLVELPPNDPYANGAFRWSPAAAWLWIHAVVPLGFGVWGALHVVVLGFLRDWRMIGLVAVTFPFWHDVLNGNMLTFAFVAAWTALRGSRTGAVAFILLAVLVPRPLFLPVLAWLLWREPWTRWPFLGIAVAIGSASFATDQLDDFVARLVASAGEVGNRWNVGPSAWLGPGWAPIGFVTAVVLTSRGRLGFASLAAAPYWFVYYLIFALLELRQLGHVQICEPLRDALRATARSISAGEPSKSGEGLKGS